VRIRHIEISDAEQFLQLSNILSRESSFMLHEPDERDLAVDEYKKTLQTFVNDTTKHLIVAEDEQMLVGFVKLIGSQLKRTRHRASIMMGIVSAYQGQGLGRKLLAVVDKLAKDKGVHRLELTVMAENKRALWLYSQCGFTVEGIRRRAIKLREAFVDEFYMSKIIALE